MLACAFLTVVAATEPSRQPGSLRQIRLTRSEIARLFTTLPTQPARDIRQLLHWSAWRRRHQHRAQ